MHCSGCQDPLCRGMLTAAAPLAGAELSGKARSDSPRAAVLTGAAESKSRLFDSSQSRIQSHDVGSQIATVRTLVDVWTAGLELVVSAVAVVVLDKNSVRIGREHVPCRPGRWRKSRRSPNQGVVGERIGGETVGDLEGRRALVGATGGTASRAPYRVHARCDNTVSKDESVHRWIRALVPQDQDAALGIQEPCDVIYRDRIHRIRRPPVCHGQQPAPTNVLPADVIHDNVVNTKAGSCRGGCSAALSISRKGGGDRDTPCGMDDVSVSDGDVCDLTDRTDVVS